MSVCLSVCVCVCVFTVLMVSEEHMNRSKGESSRLVVPKTMTAPSSSGGGVCWGRGVLGEGCAATALSGHTL